MDPLSVGASVGSLSGACIVTLKNLNELLGKFRDAPQTLRDLSSETKIISISLSQLRNVLVSDEHSVLTQSLLKPDIRNALDVALTGCNVTLSCLESEIHSLTVNIATDQKLSFSDRAKIAWKDDKFKELLQQLSRQHSAIATLNQGFQMYVFPVHARLASQRISNVYRRKAIGDILNKIVSARNCALIQKVAEDTKSLRGMYPKSNAAKSFLDSLESAGSSETNLSMISEQQFEFDDLVTNSQAYRRVLVAATHALKKNMGGTAGETGDVNELESKTVQLEKGSNSTEGANQSRKMTAAPGPARGLKYSPITNSGGDPGLQDNHSQQTINDPHSFVQQFRGYLDHVEGESRNAAKENAQLRQGLEMDAIAIEAITSQLQIATKRADHAERELKTALKNNKEMVLALQGLRTIAKLLEAASTEKGRQLDKLQSRINDLDKNITGLNSLINEYTERAWEAEDRLKVAEVEVDSLRSKLREEEAETASAKKELEELRAVQKDLSALFQKGNYIIQGKRKQVIDREK
jgi:chromosome segregation ATPase